MTNSDSFIDEVTEEVRRERLFGYFRRYGWIAVLLVLLIVGGAAWNEWRKAERDAASRAFGDALLAALEQPDAAARRTALVAIPAEGERAALRDLMLAADAGEGDRAATLAALDRLAADATLSATYRDLAVLRRVILAGATLDLPARRAALDSIAAPGRPYRTLALEQMAYLDLEAGETAQAVETLRALSQDQEATTGLRRRAQQLIVALGGEAKAGRDRRQGDGSR